MLMLSGEKHLSPSFFLSIDYQVESDWWVKKMILINLKSKLKRSSFSVEATNQWDILSDVEKSCSSMRTLKAAQHFTHWAKWIWSLLLNCKGQTCIGDMLLCGFVLMFAIVLSLFWRARCKLLSSKVHQMVTFMLNKNKKLSCPFFTKGWSWEDTWFSLYSLLCILEHTVTVGVLDIMHI